MKRSALIVMSAVILGQSGLACVRLEAQPTPTPPCPTEPTQRTVKVVVEEKGNYPADDPRRLVVTLPSKTHQTNACWGEVVEWSFENKSTFDLKLGVGHFRVVDREKHQKEMRVPPVKPVTGGADNVLVNKQVGTIVGTGALKYVVNEQPRQPGGGEGRTFKYDIVDYSRLLVLLDPELEVYKPY